MDGKEFKRLRLKARLTQEQTSRLLETATRTVVRWERGERPIPPLKVAGIRDVLAAKERT